MSLHKVMHKGQLVEDLNFKLLSQTSSVFEDFIIYSLAGTS